MAQVYAIGAFPTPAEFAEELADAGSTEMPWASWVAGRVG